MTVSLGIERKDSSAYEDIPIATSADFERQWLPACAALGLRLVPRFHDGALTGVSPDELPAIIAELETLRAWAATNDPFMAGRIDGVLQALRESASEPCEYDFG